MIQFEYFRPKSLEEALSLSARFGEKGRFMAGGTEVINELRMGKSKPEQIIDLKNIPGIDTVVPTTTGLVLGPLTRIRDLETSKYLQNNFPALSQAAGSMASTQVRNKATVGGNICRASPSADMIPPLMALSSLLKLTGNTGDRMIPIGEFLLGPGKTAIKPGEIMTGIHIPCLRHNSACTYIKLSPREQMDLAVVGVAVMLGMDEYKSKLIDIKVSLGAVGPTSLMAPQAANILIGQYITQELIEQSAAMAAVESKPMTDIRASEWYRRKMVAVLVKRAINYSLNSIKRKGTRGYVENS